LCLAALGLLAAQHATEANAAACAAGPYRAGCTGARGTVVAHRPYGYGGAVARPVAHCYWRAGVRVCR
jgi:hypothetical protein